MRDTIRQLIEEVRQAVSCCCSQHRYNEINHLMDKMEEALDKENSQSELEGKNENYN